MTSLHLEKPFSLNRSASGGEYLAINVASMGTVLIKAEHEGIVVDIYKSSLQGDPIATAAVHETDLLDFEDEPSADCHPHQTAGGPSCR